MKSNSRKGRRTASTLEIGAALLTLACLACARPHEPEPAAAGPQAQSSEGWRVVVIAHGPRTNPFWAVVARGAEDAARDTGVTVEYRAPQEFDMEVMAGLIDAAVAERVNGLVVSIPDSKQLSPAIERAVQAGIPVVSINSGGEVAEEVGALTHVGQDEYEAGRLGGIRMAKLGVRRAIFVNHEVGNRAIDDRHDGFADALKTVDGSVDVLAVDVSKRQETAQRVLMALDEIPGTQGFLAGSAASGAIILEALAETGRLDEIELATFDLSPEMLAAIKRGDVAFAIDQQQYLQGYLPVVLLKLFFTNANTPGQLMTPTGPGFVTRENVEAVIQLSAEGTR